MLAAQYTGIANTTLTGSAYFIPKVGATNKSAFSVWASAETKVNNVNLGLQVAYAKAKVLTKTYGIAAYAGTSFDAFDAKLTLAYINDGTTPLVAAKAVGLKATSGFWGNTFGGVFGGDVTTGKQKIVRLDLGYKPSFGGKIYGGVAADKQTGSKTAVAARVGYDFTVYGVAAKVEYRYHKDFAGAKNHRVRVQGVYKF